MNLNTASISGFGFNFSRPFSSNSASSSVGVSFTGGTISSSNLSSVFLASSSAASTIEKRD